MPTQFDVGLFRERHKQRTGQKAGFPTAADYERLQHVIDLPGMTPHGMGYDRFRRAYHLIRHAADKATVADFILECVYEDRHQKSGYRLHVADPVAATHLRGVAEAAMREGR